MEHRNARRRGFTLIELMIVVSIIAVLAAIATPAYRCGAFKARQREALSVLKGIYTAENLYFGKTNVFLCSENDIVTLGGVEYGELVAYSLQVTCSTVPGAAMVEVRAVSHFSDANGNRDIWAFTLGGTSSGSGANWLVHLQGTDCR